MADKEARELLKRILQANIIFPSMCANNCEAMNLLDEIDALLRAEEATKIAKARRSSEAYDEAFNAGVEAVAVEVDRIEEAAASAHTVVPEIRRLKRQSAGEGKE